jgi:hypothetical protein
MADVAKLGIDIDASSAVGATQLMRTFGTEAAAAAFKVESSVERVNARIAQMPQGISRSLKEMEAFGAGKIASPFTVDLDKQTQSIAAFESNARRLANVRLDDALAKSGAAAVASAGGLKLAADAAVHATGAHQGMNLAVIKMSEASGLGYRGGLQMAQVLSMMGPWGYVAAGAIATLGAGYLTATADAAGFANEQEKVLKVLKSGDATQMTTAIDELDQRLKDRTGITGYFREVGQRLKGVVNRDFVTGSGLNEFIGELEDKKFAVQKAQQSEITRGVQEQIRLIGADVPAAIRAQGAALATDLIPKYEKVGLSAEAAGDKAKNLAAAWTGAKINEFTAGQMKADLAIQQQVTDLQFANAAIGATERQTIALTAAQKTNALQTSDNAIQHQAATAALIAETAASAQLQTVQSFSKTIDRGKSAVGDFEKNFGVKINTDESIKNLASSFANNFNTWKNDPAQQKPLADAFNSFVSQAAAAGTKNISGLLQSVNISPADIQRLRSQMGSITTGFDTQTVEQVTYKTNIFGGRERMVEMVEQQIPIVQNLGKAYDEADAKIKNWANDAEAKKVVQSYGDIGKAVEDTNKKLTDLQTTVAQGMATNMDVSQPRTAIDSVKTWLGEIPLVTYRTIEFVTLASGSPTLPFSDYFDRYMPSKIAGIGDISPEIAVNIPDYSKRVRDIQDLTNQINAFQSTAQNKTGFHFEEINAAFAERQIKALAPQLQDAQFNLAADVYKQQQQAAPRGGAPGGGGSYSGDTSITIDLRGATITQEVLDRSLLPNFENAIKQATGKSPNYRVLN